MRIQIREDGDEGNPDMTHENALWRWHAEIRRKLD
jgi:hypothetical protein